jgi:hypothetical protein
LAFTVLVSSFPLFLTQIKTAVQAGEGTVKVVLGIPWCETPCHSAVDDDILTFPKIFV